MAKQFSRQDSFNHVYLSLIKQGKPSWNPELNQCMYRGPNGLKCAVGHLIPDSAYHESFEGSGITEAISDACNCDLYKDGTFLVYLQKCHDDALTPSIREKIKVNEEEGNSLWLEQFKYRMEHCAYVYELSIPTTADSPDAE